MSATAQIAEDRWLAGVMERPVFRVGGAEALEALRDHVAARPGAFYYAKVPATEVETVRRMGRLGFFVADVNVTLARPAPAASAGSATFGPPRPGSAAALLDLAESVYEQSRFHLDPLVPQALAARIKREWVANYVNGTRGDRLFVAYTDDAPSGFLAALLSGDTAIIDLLGVARATRGRGLGAALVQAFTDHYVGRCARLLVGTQVANQGSMRLYNRLGFLHAGSQFVLHLHVGPDGTPR